LFYADAFKVYYARPFNSETQTVEFDGNVRVKSRKLLVIVVAHVVTEILL